jgi:hypothetical protein
MRDRGGAGSLLAIGLIVLEVSACRASVKASANVNASEAHVDDERKWEVPEPPSSPQETAPTAAPTAAPRVAAAVSTAPTTTGGAQFLGVVHDLTLSSSAPRSAACRCLAVGFGPPSDAKFNWQAGAPPGDHDAIAIAIAVDGVACPSGVRPVRASIAAVEREGTDIILVVENVGAGRPIMRGALAAWPGPNGAIVVRTRHDQPYAAANGSGPCRIPLK